MRPPPGRKRSAAAPAKASADRSARKTRRPRESAAELAARARTILDLLDRSYPESRCSLDHRNAFELLVATILSAQCTDARVNLVTRELFRRAPDPAALAALPLPTIEDLIRSTGFFRNKAKAIQGAARRLVEHHGGVVPDTMDALLELPGVARKTANVVLGVDFGRAEGVVVDTHVQRQCGLLWLTRAKDPRGIEAELVRLLPRDHWIRFSHQLIDHGRAVCIANRPRCGDCVLRLHCPSAR